MQTPHKTYQFKFRQITEIKSHFHSGKLWIAIFQRRKCLCDFSFISGWILWSNISLECAALRKLRALLPTDTWAELWLLFSRPGGNLRGHPVSPADVQHPLLLQRTSANGQRESILHLFCATGIAGETFSLEVWWFMCPLEAVHRSVDVSAELQRWESYWTFLEAESALT